MPRDTQQQNLKVSYQFIRWVEGTNRGIMAHLYQFTSLTGAVDYFTDLDQDVVVNGVTWKSGALRIEGLKRKVGIGVSVDEQSVKIWASPTDTLWGSLFLIGAQQGLMDGATIVRYRVIWPFVTGNAAADIKLQPLAVWPMFSGYTSSIDKGGSSHVEFKVKSALLRLNVNMPRNYYQPGCLWSLFSAGCTLLQAPFGIASVVGSNPSSLFIPPVGGIAEPIGADGITNYAQGRLQFTSGVDNNLLVLIDNNDSNGLYLAYPLDEVPNPGDTFTYWPGCSKSYNTCEVKFNNKFNFRGFDKVPPIMVSA